MKIDSVKRVDGRTGVFYVVVSDGIEYLNFDNEMANVKPGDDIDANVYSKGDKKYLKFNKTNNFGFKPKANQDKSIAFDGAVKVALALVKPTDEKVEDKIYFTVESFYTLFYNLLKKETV